MKHEAEPFRQPRRDRMIRERVHDPYKTRLKLPEPTVCPQCGAVFHEGRWHWAPRPRPAHEELCQACHRINDRYPAGELTIKGDFAARHRDEILRLARHQEELEKAEHPLHRILAIEERASAARCRQSRAARSRPAYGGIVVQTTDIHLPRRIGEALHHAFRGELDASYQDETHFIRVKWKRER